MAEEKKDDEKKIIVDEDWKQQAEKEKEVLAAQEEAGKEKEILAAQEEAGKEKAGPQKRRGPLPKGDFAGLLSMLTTQALYSLGLVQIEGQEQRAPDLSLAKYNIEMLETLEEKTKGNLSETEQRVLANSLSELRMAFVKISEANQAQNDLSGTG